MGQAGFTQSFIGLGLLAVGFFGAYTLGLEAWLRASTFGFFILAFGLVLIGYASIKDEALPGVWSYLPLAVGAVAPLGIILGGEVLLRVAVSAAFGVGWILFGFMVVYGSRAPKSQKSEGK